MVMNIGKKRRSKGIKVIGFLNWRLICLMIFFKFLSFFKRVFFLNLFFMLNIWFICKMKLV